MLKDLTNYFANFDGTTNACRTVALWITITLAVAFIATKLYAAILWRHAEKTDDAAVVARKTLNGAWIVVALVVAVAFIVMFAACYFSAVANGEDTLVPILFYPMLALLAAVAASAITLFVKPNKIAKIVCAAVCGAALVAVVACMAAYYAGGETDEAFSELGLYLSAAAVTAGVVVFAFFTDRKSAPFDTRTVTFAAVCIALSFALSYIRLFKMPMGGSITFASMLPLMLFAYMFGSRKGILAGLIYGVLQAIQDPWIIHPAQFALDYAVAFAAVGLTGCIRELGLFKNNTRAKFALGATVACAFRFLSHYFAGVFAFGTYGAVYAETYNMPALANAYLYSFVYQCMYILPELVLVLIVGMLVMSSKSFKKQIEFYAERGIEKSESEQAGANS